MANKQLIEYIKKEQGLGKSDKEIKKILSDAEWHKDAISDAFNNLGKPNSKDKEETTPSTKYKEVKIHKKQKVRPIFLIIWSFFLGAAAMMVVSILLLSRW